MIGSIETIITKYVADVSGYAPAVEKIAKLQDKLAESTQKAGDASTEAGTASESSSLKMIKGLGAVVGALAVAKAGWSEFQAISRLANASAGYDLQAVTDATGGTLTQMQVMQLAANANAGAYKLTQKELETTAASIRGFTKDGYDQEKALDKVSDALSKGYGGSLDDLGVNLDRAKTKGEDFKVLMEALGVEANKASTGTMTQSESMAALGTSFKDSFSKMKVGIGEVVVAMQPLLQALASVVGLVAEVVGKVGKGWSEIGQLVSDGKDAYKYLAGNDTGDKILGRDPSGEAEKRLRARYMGGTMNARENFVANGGKGSDFDSSQILYERQLKDRAETEKQTFADMAKGIVSLGGQALNAYNALSNAVDDRVTQFQVDQFKKRQDMSKKSSDEARKSALEDRKWMEDFLVKNPTGSAGYRKGVGAFVSYQEDTFELSKEKKSIDRSLGDKANGGALDSMRILNREYAGSEQANNDYAKFSIKDGESRLEKMFGPVEDFDLYSGALAGLNVAIYASQEAFGAWIDGSKSFSEAFEEVMGQQLKSISKEMFGQSLRHAAYAVGELAFGHVGPAAAHAIAAAEFGVGAVALGYAGAAVSGSPSKSTKNPADNGKPSDRSENVGLTFIVGDDFADDSPRMRERKATRVLQAARRSQGVIRN